MSTTVNKLVREFLASDTDLLDLWNGTDNQKSLKSALKPFETQKKKKDPNAPKKASSAYIYFSNSQRASLKEESPDLSSPEIMKELARRWKETTMKQREPFEKVAVAARVSYDTEMAAYVEPEDAGVGTKKQKKKKDPNAPAKNMSAYLFFCASERIVIAEEEDPPTGRDIVKEIGTRWHTLTAEDKEPFETMAAEDKERYAEQMKSYTPPDGGVVVKPAPPAPKKASAKKPAPATKKAAAAKKPAPAPKKPAPAPKKPAVAKTGYSLFVQDNKQDVKDENPKWSAVKVNKELKVQWDELTDTDRDSYN
jgi:hypothetical protein